MINPYEDGKLILKTLLIGIFVLSIVGYGIFQAQKIVKGPQLTVESPIQGSNSDTSLIDIKGNAKNISAITLNDRSIYTDESGAFSEKLMLYPGYNIIKLRVEDKFGSLVEKDIEVVYTQNY
ncbi:MAG TPA: hypothetical protein VGE62_03860 [Candidatus Paceibacterota bacterium]